MAVWSTESVKNLLKRHDDTGVMPRDNPFYLGDVEYRAANMTFAYTNEEFLELGKCAENILYFGETYAKVMTDEGVRVVKLRPYQKRTLLQFKRFRFNVMLSSRQSGKCVQFNTKVKVKKKDQDQEITMPIFRFHYESKKNKLKSDYIEWFLLEMLAVVDNCIDYLESRIDQKGQSSSSVITG